ncbi:MAG: HDOD domain-containing protein [Proteobacteria bacterium]|nr:HDOD domain-containing protein [Pseudomonadota bacterium]
MLGGRDMMAEVPKLAEALPPFPGIVLQLLDRMHDEETSLDGLVRLARNDPVITSNILANANHIRRLHAQSDLADPFAAASLIGLNRLRGIVVAAGMNQFLEKGKGGAFLFKHSQAVAIVAQELAAMCGVSTEMAYVAGILHDIGQLCFHILDEQAFKDAYEQSSIDGKLLEREVDIFGLDHCRIGALIAEHWKLPQEFVSTILTHHDEATVTSRLQATICLAESLARALDIPPSQKNRVTKINVLALETLGLRWNSPEMLDCFGRCHARFHQILDDSRG